MNHGLTQTDIKQFDDLLAKANDQQVEHLYQSLLKRLNKIKQRTYL